MNCHYCFGQDTYEDTKIRYFSGGQTPFFVDGLPASVCIQCGEKLLSSDTMDVLDSIRNGAAHPVSVAVIPVYDFDNPAGQAAKSGSYITQYNSYYMNPKVHIAPMPCLIVTPALEIQCSSFQ